MSNIWYCDTDHVNIMKPKYFTALKQPDFAHEVKNLLILLTNKKKLSYELSQLLQTTLADDMIYSVRNTVENNDHVGFIIIFPPKLNVQISTL